MQEFQDAAEPFSEVGNLEKKLSQPHAHLQYHTAQQDIIVEG
jgi:hypothetical protein